MKKLVLTLTITILTHIWKTRNRLQFHDTIITTTNTIINIKNDVKTYTNTLQRTRNKQYDKRIRKKTSVSTTHYVQKQETLLHYCSSDNYLE